MRQLVETIRAITTANEFIPLSPFSDITHYDEGDLGY